MQNILRKLKRQKKAQIKRFNYWRRHPFGAPIALFVGLLIIGGVIILVLQRHHSFNFSNDTHIVIVSHDGGKETVPTNAKTVGNLLVKLHLHIGKYDRVEPSADTEILQDNFRVNVYRAVPVTVQDGTRMITGYSAATTARSIAMQSGVSLYAEDVATAKPAENLIDEHSVGQVVTIDRSIPINLNIYGTPTATRTHAKTVAGLIAEKHIELGNGATLTPAGSTPLTPNMAIFVLNKGQHITSVEETVPMPVQKVDDNSLTLGSTAVRQVGSPGKQLTTYEITLDANGKEVSRKILQTVVTQEAVPQIVAVGKYVSVPADKTAIMQAVGISPSDYGYVDFIVSHEGGWGGVTKYNRAGSGAYGICQALPGSKMASAGADWATNPVTQLRWCNGYAGKYGGWGGAYNYWVSHHYW